MSLGEQVALAGLSGGRELSLAKQLHTGQRVLIRMKRSEFDLEPQQYTGIIKYVGKIDSEFIDNRVYVGVKLDEPGELLVSFSSSHTCTHTHTHTHTHTVGDTDGLVKGKRYFHCPAKHGKVVRLSNVVAVLPEKVKILYTHLTQSSFPPPTSIPILSAFLCPLQSVSYKPLQMSRRSPYTTATTSHKRVKVT